jgi:hypothetical protein
VEGGYSGGVLYQEPLSRLIPTPTEMVVMKLLEALERGQLAR